MRNFRQSCTFSWRYPLFSNMKRMSVLSLPSRLLVILPVILSDRVGFTSLISWNSLSPSSSFLFLGEAVTSMERRDGWRMEGWMEMVSWEFLSSSVNRESSLPVCGSSCPVSGSSYPAWSCSCWSRYLVSPPACGFCSPALPGLMEQRWMELWTGCLQTLRTNQSEQSYQCYDLPAR